VYGHRLARIAEAYSDHGFMYRHRAQDRLSPYADVSTESGMFGSRTEQPYGPIIVGYNFYVNRYRLLLYFICVTIGQFFLHSKQEK
jgi:hypothetical protein